jgi:hypothetical protein
MADKKLSSNRFCGFSKYSHSSEGMVVTVGNVIGRLLGGGGGGGGCCIEAAAAVVAVAAVLSMLE